MKMKPGDSWVSQGDAAVYVLLSLQPIPLIMITAAGDVDFYYPVVPIAERPEDYIGDMFDDDDITFLPAGGK